MEERENSAKEKVEKLTDKTKTEQEKAQERVRVAKAKKQQKTAKQKAKLATKNKREQEKKKKQQEREVAKSERVKLKREKQAQKAEIKRQKLEQKALAKADKRQKREARSQRRSSRGVGGWIASVVSLGVACLILATLLTVNMYGGLKNFPQTMVAQSYNQCLEEFTTYNQNIDTNLSKFFVSNSKGEQQRLLIKISEESLLAEENLQRLPLNLEQKHYTTKVVNQIGDYSKYLNNKLIDGLSISQEDRENLYRLYQYNKNIKDGLQRIANEINRGEKIEKIFLDNGIAEEVFTSLEDMAVVYPQLIYDGPFSDGLNTKKAKGLGEQEITDSQAEKIFKGIFNSYKLNQHQVVGEFNGQIKCYTINAKDEFGNDLYAEISKQGGKLIMFNYQRVCDSKQDKFDTDDCTKIGRRFLFDLGIKNMSAVWVEETEDMATINYAYEQNGIIVYPDLIKLNICKNTGVVFGLEGTNYYLNHTKREFEKAKLTEEQALKLVSQNLQVQSVRLALIPKGNSREVLTYEISGENKDGFYFVYINAINGQEEQIFKVVDTSEGQLLI